MSATLPAAVLQDELALSLAHVVATANKRASEAGVDVQASLITITQASTEATDGAAEEAYWRVNYGPRGLDQRGGDFIVDVRARDASVKRVLLGQ